MGRVWSISGKVEVEIESASQTRGRKTLRESERRSEGRSKSSRESTSESSRVGNADVKKVGRGDVKTEITMK